MRLSAASLRDWDIATEAQIAQSVMSLNALTMLTQVLVTNRIAGFNTLIGQLSYVRFRRAVLTMQTTGTSLISAVNSQNPMEPASIPQF